MPLLVENRQLLEGFRRGEPAALLRVYQHYAPAVGDYLYRLGVRSAIEVDDLIQDTFLRAFDDQARMTYDGLKPYRNYLLTIARNRCWDVWKKKRPELVEPEQLDEGPGEHVLEPPERSAEQAELQALVNEYLVGLSSTDRRLVQLRFEDRLSQDVAAAHLGVSRQQLRTREKHIRGALYAHLATTGYVDFVARSRSAPDLATAQVALLLFGILEQLAP